MKRKSKFYKPKLEEGGLFQNPNLMGMIGGGASMLTGLIPSATSLNQEFTGDDRYMADMEKAGKPTKIMNTIGSAAMATGNPFAMAGGLALQGVSKLVGKRAAKKAASSAQIRQDSGAMKQNFKLGALASNSIPKFKAPAYGKLGMKFKSKFNRE